MPWPLEELPRLEFSYCGSVLFDFDLDTTLARMPEFVLVDEGAGEWSLLWFEWSVIPALGGPKLRTVLLGFDSRDEHARSSFASQSHHSSPGQSTVALPKSVHFNSAVLQKANKQIAYPLRTIEPAAFREKSFPAGIGKKLLFPLLNS